MDPQKMTSEELTVRLHGLRTSGFKQCADAFEAHIAALGDELREAGNLVRAARGGQDELRQQVAALEAERDASFPYDALPKGAIVGDQVARRIVERIVDDLTDRRGLRQAWDEIDLETQIEICGCWRRLIQDELKTTSAELR